LPNVDIVKEKKDWSLLGLIILQAKYLEPMGSASINLMILFSRAESLLGIDKIVISTRKAWAVRES